MFLRENEIGRRVADHLEPGMSVLDVGAGTGRISRWLRAHRGIRPTLADVTEFGNRVGGMPFLPMDDPLRIPAEDRSFDAVVMLFVLHHIPSWRDQERLLGEAARVARRRVLMIEDTPGTRVDRAFNVAWDWVLNLRHGVPKPFTFRSVQGWSAAAARAGLAVEATETYRPRWPTLMTYPHTLFSLRPVSEAG